MEEFKHFINRISPLSDLSMEALLSCFELVSIKKGTFFDREEAYATKIGFIQKGIARAFFTNEQAKEYNKQFFVAPALVGSYTSLLTKKPNKIAQQALTDCVVLVANFTDIQELYKYHDIERLGRKIAEYFFIEKEEKELEMALLDADKRYELLQNRFPRIEMEIPQYHIASYLGISATQLSRIRKKITLR